MVVSDHTSKYLAEKYVDCIRSNPDMPLEHLQQRVRKDLMVDISHTQAYRAKRKTLDLIEGTNLEQFGSGGLVFSRLTGKPRGRPRQGGNQASSSRGRGLVAAAFEGGQALTSRGRGGGGKGRGRIDGGRGRGDGGRGMGFGNTSQPPPPAQASQAPAPV
ncbi:hypothetical protein RHGRI_017002 [Rhododendron griersonianum]|uniref:Uncharacterized protein n=1 Tax=Rhododendron griersonianum TaxID=479676 RepID=A0AAV6JW82_9ERIC|nr:hypothetical protein RHGRI_017002 [Rhododendron griersonianum]